MATLQTTLDCIKTSHAVLADYLKDHTDQEPSFEADGPLSFNNAPESVNDARHALVAAARDLQLLALYPTEAVNYLGLEATGKTSLRFVIHFAIQDHIPLQGMISYEELASKIPKIPQQRLTRILRHAMLDRFFHEPKPGYVAHSALSAGLVTSPAMRSTMNFLMGASTTLMSTLITATEKYGEEAEKAENAPMSVVAGPGQVNPFEEWGKNDPEKLVEFLEVMKASVEGMSIDQVVKGYDWEAIGDGIFVDVGGGLGHIGVALASHFPSLNVVIQDVAPAVAHGQSQLPSHLSSRVTFMAHDFYQTNPIKGASIYFFSRIMHDWPDESASKILQAVVQVMGPESKIVISDKIMPEVGQGARYDERLKRSYDLQMMVMNGLERTMEQWGGLIAKADGRLKISKVLRPEGAYGSLIEVSWERADSPLAER